MSDSASVRYSVFKRVGGVGITSNRHAAEPLVRTFRAVWFLAGLLVGLPASAAEEFPKIYDTEKGAPMSAEEAARTMELPEGFKCVVFAAEPDVQNPIAMAWDAKGRMWVAENYTYAERQKRFDAGVTPDFLPETNVLRSEF